MSSEFEERLIEAGNELLDPPASVEDLLTLLDKAEYYLARVEQSPCKSIEDALSPCTKALVADKLFKHSNTDVMAAVASCISEITRITAPEAPYSDEEMKEAFQLIVSSFEHLDDMCSRSYTKRALILETVAKVRSCVVMLDLECDALIVEMFKHFFKAIRDYHPENVFSSMETIMTLVIEESEDISTELLSPILDTLKKDNEGVLPIAKKLGENVLQNCSTKLKDFLGQTMISLGSCMDDYSEVVSIICQDGTSENKKTDATPGGQHEVDKETASPKPETGNGVKQQAEDDSLADIVSVKPEIVRQRPRLKITGLKSKDKTNNSGAEREAEPARKSKKAGRKRGRKWSSVKKSTKHLGGTSTDSKKEPSQPVENGEDPSSNPRSPPENQSIGADLPSDGGKKVDVAPPPNETGTESLGISSLSKSEEPEKKEGSIKESEGPNNSVRKEYAGLGKKSEGASNEDRTPIKVRISRKRSEATDNAKVNTMTPSPDKVNASTADKEGSSLKSVKFKDKKGTAKGKEVHQKDVLMSSEKDAEEGKVVSLSKKTKKRSRDEDQPIETPKAKGRKRQKVEDQPLETPKDKGKRKRTPAKEVSDAKEYGEELVGSKVKVWWPKDKAFYEGVVDSFDALKKKHTVLYVDGDVENLNLRKERWEIIQDNSGPNEEQKVAESSRQSSPDMTLKVLLEMRSNKKLSSKKGKGISSKKSEAVSPTSDHKPRAESKNDANLETAGGGKADSNTPNIGSKLVGLARQMTSRSKGSIESKKDETKKEKSKKDLETAAKSRTPRSVGRPRKVKSGDSDKGKSGSSKRKLKDNKDPDIDSGGAPPSKKSSLSKPKLKESKVDRDSGEDLSDKVKSSSSKMKAEESKEKSSSLKMKAEESKDKNVDSGEEPSDKVKSSLLKPKPNESKEVDMDSGEELSDKVMSGSLKPKESEKVDEDSGEEPSEKLKSCSSKPKEKRKLEESDEVDEDSGEEPSDKVKSNSSKPEPEENEDMDQDSGNETEKENASEKETPVAESSPKPARGQKTGRKRRRGA